MLALVDVQVKVVLAPAARLVGLAVSVQVGALVPKVVWSVLQ